MPLSRSRKRLRVKNNSLLKLDDLVSYRATLIQNWY
jgi:hypothetical protein